MIAAAASLSWPVRALRGLADLAVGGFLCATPVTSVLALGWIARQAAAVQTGAGRPGWILGPRGAGWIVRLLGGLAANIRAGLVMFAGLSVWTLPFTLLWLLSWWAGWENSFAKGYEQAWVGPTVFLAGSVLALPVLALLPHVVTYAAGEGRFGAFFEFRPVFRLAGAAGWRGLWLAVLSVLAALPLFGLAALPVFVEQVFPNFARLAPAEQAALGEAMGLAAAAYAFAALWFLRDRTARLAVRPRPRARLAALWLVLSAAVWSGLVVLILVAQFLNYAGYRWLTHPLFLLPWPG
jgi:hypothetical protein